MDENFHTVLDEDMRELMESIGQLEALKNGEIYCIECGSPLALKTIQTIMPVEENNYHFICNNTVCVKNYLQKKD